MKKVMTLIALMALSTVANAGWEYQGSSDPFDGTKITNAMGIADNQRAMIVVHCENDGGGPTWMILAVFVGEYFEDGYHTLQYKVDDNEPGEISLVKMPGGNLANEIDLGHTLVQQLKAGSKLVMRATPYREMPTTVTISLSGATSKINEARTNCE